MVGLYGTRRPGSSENSSKGCTYYLSGMSDVYHVKWVAIGISSRLQLFVVEVISVDKHIM